MGYYVTVQCKTETDKLIAGEAYDGSSDEIYQLQCAAEKLLIEFRNSSSHTHKKLLKELLGKLGKGSTIKAPFFCEYGKTISIGKRTYINMNVTMLDGAPISIGNNVLIGPGTGIFTATHPLDYRERRKFVVEHKPITIEDDVWIGGNVTINPDVTIGYGSVVGSGSVVTKDVPAMTVVVGNPAKFVKKVEVE